MDFTRLRIFRAVAEQGSFAAAADALDYTPSAVSQQMARLEAELGAELVTRTGRGTTLTPAGERLLPHARDILERVARARKDLHGAEDRLRVASFATAATAFVAGALRAVRDQHPAVLLEREPFNAVADLRAGHADLAVVYQRDGFDLGQDFTGVRVADPAGLAVRRLLTEPYRLAVPPGHPLADAATVDPARLDGELMIGSTYWPGVGTLAANLGEHGVTLRFDELVSESYTTVLPLVASGAGIALVPELALAGVDERVVIRDLGDLAPVRPIDLVTVPGRDRAGLHELVRLIVAGARRVKHP